METDKPATKPKPFEGFKVRCPREKTDAYMAEATAQGRSLSSWILHLAEAELARAARRKKP